VVVERGVPGGGSVEDLADPAGVEALAPEQVDARPDEAFPGPDNGGRWLARIPGVGQPVFSFSFSFSFSLSLSLSPFSFSWHWL
jgi:hypothetical protein